MSKQLVFRNPVARSRSEKFGGLVKVESQVFLLGPEPYAAFLNFDTPRIFEEVECELGHELLQGLIASSLLLTIPKEEADKILEERRS